jgi:hypothetical protein
MVYDCKGSFSGSRSNVQVEAFSHDEKRFSFVNRSSKPVFSHPVGAKKASNDRLLQWADVITSFSFVVEHIPCSFKPMANQKLQ